RRKNQDPTAFIHQRLPSPVVSPPRYQTDRRRTNSKNKIPKSQIRWHKAHTTKWYAISLHAEASVGLVRVFSRDVDTEPTNPLVRGGVTVRRVEAVGCFSTTSSIVRMF
ncbi:hypothetical protein GWI33_021751, partial [Rhynchophorus ferrugineus]